jgi:hypothetical protein
MRLLPNLDGIQPNSVLRIKEGAAVRKFCLLFRVQLETIGRQARSPHESTVGSCDVEDDFVAFPDVLPVRRPRTKTPEPILHPAILYLPCRV